MAQGDWYEGNVIPLLSNNDDVQTAYNMQDNYLNLKELSKCPLPLGLKLTLTPEMLPYTEQETNVANYKVRRTPCHKKVDHKLKAVHFPMSILVIGFYKIEAKYPADLVAKFYYAKRKLVWEILRDGLKDKIEIQWQNISAIRAVMEANLPGILEIELDKVPLFFREIDPKPGKHTMWTISHDFTDGLAASKYRRHYLQFPPGVLDRYYAKLLQCDDRLLKLSHRPFPSSCAACFDSHLDLDERTSTHFLFCHDSETTSVTMQQPFLASRQQVQLLGPLPQITNYYNYPTSPTSDEAINNQMLQDPMLIMSQDHHYDTLLSVEPVTRASGIQQNGPCLNSELPSHINTNMLLRDYTIPEIEFDRRRMRDIVELVSPNVGYNANTITSTQIDWSHTNKNSWNVRTDNLEQQYYASNANLNSMRGDPFIDINLVLSTQKSSFHQVCNESSFSDPCT